MGPGIPKTDAQTPSFRHMKPNPTLIIAAEFSYIVFVCAHGGGGVELGIPVPIELIESRRLAIMEPLAPSSNEQSELSKQTESQL